MAQFEGLIQCSGEIVNQKPNIRASFSTVVCAVLLPLWSLTGIKGCLRILVSTFSLFVLGNQLCNEKFCS